MKHKVEVELAVFQPVSVTITAENPDDLLALLHVCGNFDRCLFAEKVGEAQGFRTMQHCAPRDPSKLGGIAYRTTNYLYSQLYALTEELAARTKGGVL